MAHSQKSIRDHARNRSHPNVNNEVISQQLEDLVKPCVYNQLADYRSLGMRERILGLPLMLAAVLTLVWRQVPSARELNRMLARENLLWAKATVGIVKFLLVLVVFYQELYEGKPKRIAELEAARVNDDIARQLSLLRSPERYKNLLQHVPSIDHCNNTE